ncbi:hypothetical protein [Streptomyces sp. NPDC058572]|uniref:hypothetical protein n=1 Tax=Streptomyces sp. NPDC058572 TaxID=3346546 RepID=UPI003657F5D0
MCSAPPAPLVRVGRARTWAVGEVFGIGSALLDDVRPARAPDALAPELDRIAGAVGARAIARFGIDVSRLHRDMTGLSVHGDFPAEDQDEQYPVIGYGRPEGRRVVLKQVQAGLAVSADGGIPVHARVFDGGAAEVGQVVGAMEDLQGMAGARELSTVADSRPVSCANVAALLAAGVDLIAPVPAAQVKDEVHAALDLAQVQAVDRGPGRDVDKPAAERESYRVLEDVHTMAGRRKRDPVHRVRRVLVHSTAGAAGRRRAREKRPVRAGEEMDELAGTTAPTGRSRPGSGSSRPSGTSPPACAGRSPEAKANLPPFSGTSARVVAGGEDPGPGPGGVLARAAVAAPPVLVEQAGRQVRSSVGHFLRDVGGVGALGGALVHGAGFLQAGEREVEEAVGAVALGEVLAEVGRHAVVEAGIVRIDGRCVREVDAASRSASAACRSDRPSRNCSMQAVAGWAGKMPGRPSRGYRSAKSLTPQPSGFRAPAATLEGRTHTRLARPAPADSPATTRARPAPRSHRSAGDDRHRAAARLVRGRCCCPARCSDSLTLILAVCRSPHRTWGGTGVSPALGRSLNGVFTG